MQAGTAQHGGASGCLRERGIMAINEKLRKKIVASEIRALTDFGYKGINESTLYSGDICTMFFESHLKDALDHPSCGGDLKDTLAAELEKVESALKKGK